MDLLLDGLFLYGHYKKNKQLSNLIELKFRILNKLNNIE